jgi:nitrile hydratase subunit beta
MNSVHDLGGMDGLGPVIREANEPAFHHEWERKVMPLFIATFAAGCFNVDEFRHAIEHMSPVHYLSSTYYEHWLEAMYALLTEKGFVTPEEIASGRVQAPLKAGVQKLPVSMVAPLCATGATARVDAEAPIRFRVGERVRARNMHPVKHTRLPRYARGRVGTIESDEGVFVLPDANAHGSGPSPQRMYNVRFTAQELWGSEASPKDSLYLSLFDSYLERV